jgi:3-oxoacyl-[acyl-carrier protein] reductase
MSARVMVITGTSRGIGRGLAEHYLKAGWIVFGCSRGAATVKHPAYHHRSFDLTDEAALTALLRDAAQAGPLEALINNAGIAAMNHLLLTSTATARQLMEVNFLAAFVALREAGKLMSRRKSGRIINFSTIAVPLDLAGEALYAASKSALESLTRTAARELAPFNITVNTIGPCPHPTRLIEGISHEKLDTLRHRQAIPLNAELSDIIAGVDFFLSPNSRLYTGQTLYLGGVFS